MTSPALAGPLAVDAASQLDAEQLGHLRHIVRLARQAPGDWSDMGPYDPTQEGDDSYRYQLAYLAYTLGVAQYHQLPAYRELFRETFSALIDKMLRHDVWGFWELTSRGSKVIDPDLEGLGAGWIDPVRRMNIMYSGHLLMMVSLYEMLYRDGKYDAPGALTFEARPPFRGMGPEDFAYDHTSLLEAIVSEFHRNNGLGCECEPNGIFVYCNQFPLLAMQHYDYVHGTEISGPLFRRFREAWAERSDLFSDDPEPDLPVFFQVRQQAVVTEGAEDNNEGASVLSWGPLMHVWQKQYVEALYPAARDQVVEESEHGLRVRMERFCRTHADYQARPSTELVDPMMMGVHTHGMLALLAAELGDAPTLAGLLSHADAEMRPTWKQGGLFYPRCDDLGADRYVTCVTGNALLGAARLTPPDGLWSLYARPWDDAMLGTPQVVDVPYPEVLVTEARHDAATGGLVVGVRPDDGAGGAGRFAVADLRAGSRHAVEIDGQRVAELAPDDAPVATDTSSVAWDRDGARLRVQFELHGPRRVVVTPLG